MQERKGYKKKMGFYKKEVEPWESWIRHTTN